MSSIVLLDTSIYLNVLDVPSFNQDRDAVLDRFSEMVEEGDYFLLPMATIWETGNHIADLATGGLRREYAKKLVDEVAMAMEGESPYRPTHFPDREQFVTWLREFPDYAARQKSEKKEREGISLSDFSIIKEWEVTRDRHNMSRVMIWSLDSDLVAYDTGEVGQ